MASSAKCEYCGATIRSDQETCPACGAPNPGYVPGSAEAAAQAPQGRPATIAELQAFCAAKGMPLQKMRFFIGTDERSPRCFGIYRDGDAFVVYKNKSDGSRAIRYRGPDEAFAVNEIYTKLLEEHRLRNGSGQGGGARSGTRQRGNSVSKKTSRLIIIVIILVVLAFNALRTRMGHRNDGYYRIGEDLFYRYGASWFLDSGSDGSWYEVDSFPYDNAESYYQGDDYNASWGSSDFSDSTYWDDLHSSSDSDSDSDWDSDYDSWDSGDTDWDSDW